MWARLRNNQGRKIVIVVDQLDGRGKSLTERATQRANQTLDFGLEFRHKTGQFVLRQTPVLRFFAIKGTVMLRGGGVLTFDGPFAV